MARNRNFDERDVLDGAMNLFRRKGYQATSIQDLETATGLKAGSIYNSFDDKAGLFNAAFAHYNDSVLLGRIARHAPAGSGLDGLRALFTTLLHEPDDGAFGCLITNIAIETGGGRAPHPEVENGLEILRKFLTAHIRAIQQSGALRPGTDADSTALRLLALYQGVLVLVRAGWDKPSLQHMIDNMFDAMEKTHDD